MTVSGIQAVQKKLTESLALVKNSSRKGLIKGAFLIKRDAMLNCPVVTGNLKNSAYVIAKDLIPKPPMIPNGKIKSAKTNIADWMKQINMAQIKIMADPSYVEIGFTAAYAFYVHESIYSGGHSKASNKGKSINKGTFKSEVGGPKFLERAVNANMGKILLLCGAEIKKDLPK